MQLIDQPKHEIARRLTAKALRNAETGCWEWTAARRQNGYGAIGDGTGRTYVAHRLAAHVWLGLDLSLPLDVCHRCDNRACINPAHLFIGTRSDNMRDASRKGRLPREKGVPKGEDHPSAKMTVATVLEARQRRRDLGVPIRRLAREYGVTPQAIRNMLRGVTWKCVGEAP